MILASLLSIADLITTIFITTHGGVELNPLAQVLSLPVFLILKFILTLILCVLTYLKIKHQIKGLYILTTLFIIVYTLALINNIGVIICYYTY